MAQRAFKRMYSVLRRTARPGSLNIKFVIMFHGGHLLYNFCANFDLASGSIIGLSEIV